LGYRDDWQDRTLTKAHLQLEAHADGIVIVRTEWIGPAALIGNVPVVTLVELKESGRGRSANAPTSG
jgi:hypothetical protein